jgi:predicted HD phosphohydrolase
MTSVEPRRWATSMEERTADEWKVLNAEWEAYKLGLPDRVLYHLRELDRQESTFPVSRLGHSLQVATRAAKAGRDDEYVLCALIHDIGDTLGTYNHADIAAAVLKPFVRPEYHWMVEKHNIFQGYFFWHHIGGDRNARDQFWGHKWYDLTAEFCEEYDQNSFDPSYSSYDLEEFRPLVLKLMAAPRPTSAG